MSRGSEDRPRAPNLLAGVPRRRVAAEVDDQGKVVLLRPRFLRGPLAWWLQPRLPRPYFRVHLDEVGSLVWQHMDGERTVADIAAAMEAAFGDRVAPAEDRLALFLREMERGSLVEMTFPADEPGLNRQDPSRP